MTSTLKSSLEGNISFVSKIYDLHDLKEATSLVYCLFNPSKTTLAIHLPEILWDRRAVRMPFDGIDKPNYHDFFTSNRKLLIKIGLHYLHNSSFTILKELRGTIFNDCNPLSLNRHCYQRTSLVQVTEEREWHNEERREEHSFIL